jgi:hypothetical protein
MRGLFLPSLVCRLPSADFSSLRSRLTRPSFGKMRIPRLTARNDSNDVAPDHTQVAYNTPRLNSQPACSVS